MSRSKARNKFEQSVWDQLKRAKIKFVYEGAKVPYKIEANYYPDFVFPTGMMIETKGYLRPEDKRKMVSVKKTNPHLDIRIVFQKATPAYIRWAERNGFPWAEKKIPKDWLN